MEVDYDETKMSSLKGQSWEPGDMGSDFNSVSN